VSFRKTYLVKDAWRDVNGNYSTQTDPELDDVVGIVAPWLVSNPVDKIYVVFDLKGVLSADFLIEGADMEGTSWSTVASLTAADVRHHPRRAVTPYGAWRSTISNFEVDPRFDGHSIDVWIES
jgi:hypothetical protein